MKKVTLREATKEQIAKHIEMHPEEWGITFDGFHLESTKIEKDDEKIDIELWGGVNLKNNRFSNAIAPAFDVIYKVRYTSVNWDEKIEVDEEEEKKNFYWIIDVCAGCESGYSFSVKCPKKGFEGDAPGKLNDDVVIAANKAGYFRYENEHCGCGVQGPFEADDYDVKGWVEDAREIKLD